ncbi:MAG: VOC family protein [Pseudomonadales bacterium]|nr:VOC family protein [Pseudomonadales bacterium]
MSRFSLLLLSAVLIFSGTIGAEPATVTKPPMAGAQYHHVHMRAHKPEEAAAWYAGLPGGERTRVGPWEAVRFRGVALLFYPAAQPGADGLAAPDELKSSEGSAIDHLGFSFANLDEGLNRFLTMGAEVVQPPTRLPGSMLYAVVRDPWGQPIRVLEDPALTGFHHVHLASPDPDRTRQWFQRFFGGEKGRFQGFPALRFDDMWLLVSASEGDVAPSMYRMIDHLGWSVSAMDEQMLRVKADGVRVIRDKFLFGGIRNIAFIESPSGVLIEILEAE